MTKCIFCEIVKGNSPAKIRKETKNILAFNTINPVAENHILIIPKKHIETFASIDKSDKEVVYELAVVLQDIINDKKFTKGYKIVVNGGKYQFVKHLHFHLLAGKLGKTSDIINKI